MSSFLNNDQITDLKNIFSNHFDTFASGSNVFISIIKQPINIINNSSADVFAGYSSDSMNISDITYSSVTGVYPAIIIDKNNAFKSSQFAQLKFNLDENDLIIKVEHDCRKFLKQGKTEAILIDGNRYNMSDSTDVSQNYFGLQYYYFRITSTK